MEYIQKTESLSLKYMKEINQFWHNPDFLYDNMVRYQRKIQSYGYIGDSLDFSRQSVQLRIDKGCKAADKAFQGLVWVERIRSLNKNTDS
jgi:hypothetical protein